MFPLCFFIEMRLVRGCFGERLTVLYFVRFAHRLTILSSHWELSGYLAICHYGILHLTALPPYHLSGNYPVTWQIAICHYGILHHTNITPSPISPISPISPPYKKTKPHMTSIQGFSSFSQTYVLYGALQSNLNPIEKDYS
ncbi:Uncharacterised protein [Myroides odoratus]|uniref:Uncharacterized protein n=1 Tax=Myroides odoratus TaxID=256 RepID=A0A378RLW1_MYROD|nr:Uncharacterised protein [Myroides odoratus]